MKFLIWGLLIAAVVLWVLWSKRTIGAARDRQRKEMMQGAPPPAAEPMLQCAHCGIHLPSSEALAGKDGQAYCSAEHLRLHGAE